MIFKYDGVVSPEGKEREDNSFSYLVNEGYGCV